MERCQCREKVGAVELSRNTLGIHRKIFQIFGVTTTTKNLYKLVCMVGKLPLRIFTHSHGHSLAKMRERQLLFRFAAAPLLVCYLGTLPHVGLLPHPFPHGSQDPPGSTLWVGTRTLPLFLPRRADPLCVAAPC